MVLRFIVICWVAAGVCFGLYLMTNPEARPGYTAPEPKPVERTWFAAELRATPSGALIIGRIMTKEELEEQLEEARSNPPPPPVDPRGF